MSRKIVLSDYNSNDTEKRRANLSFIGNNLNIDADKLYVSKFKITSSNLPVWIPNIIETPEKYIASDTYTEYFADQPEFWKKGIVMCQLNLQVLFLDTRKTSLTISAYHQDKRF